MFPPRAAVPQIVPSPRWTAVTESAYAWEAEALAWLRDRLPDALGYFGWSNFEFVAGDGAVNEVDALILTPTKLLLVEIKSRPGTVRADAGAWEWTFPDGSRRIDDNPLILANRKAKRLAGLLKSTKSLKGKPTPYVEEVVFLSQKDTRAEFTGPAGTRVFLRTSKQGGERDLSAYIAAASEDSRGDRMDATQIRAVQRALDELNIRPVQRQFTVGPWKLGALLEDTSIYQDYIGEHTKVAGSRRRIRIYPWPASGPETGRKARREAAKREFQLLDRADQHAGLLAAQALEETERGPAIVFEHPDPSERLDAFLLRRAPALDLRQRLRLVRELADVLAWAHSQGMHHRTLTPSAVLVVRPDEESPTVKLFNWQVGTLAEGTASGSTLTWHDFLQVGLGDRHENAVYLAPELRGGGRPDPALLDVFSLGAIAYHLLAGRAPAATAEELLERLKEGRGLRLAAALDGVDQDLDALVQMATSPDLTERPTADEFRRLVDEVVGRLADEAAAPEPERGVHPMDAEKGAELDGGFVVRRRLGSGSTALALEVELESKMGVLKIARNEDYNDRIRQEGEILRRLRHQHVVELIDVVEVSGLAALFLERAGEETLAQRLRREGSLTLDLLQRFGEELLLVVDWLEQQGIPHRDIKPDNIGVSETRTKKLTLELFDFSLSSTPADNVRAGTPGYLDPFLEERKPRRWDTAAERYAAAITLHEMATGSQPVWGDGRQHPMTLPADVKPTLAGERFDPAVRDALTRFFLKALARDPKARFDTAEAMRAAWRDIFRAIDEPAVTATTSTSDGGSVDALAAVAAADPDTPLAVLGLTPRVLNALERLGVQRLIDLVELPRTKLHVTAGVGIATRKAIRDLAEAAARAFAERGLGEAGTLGGDAMPGEPEDGGAASLDPALLHVELLQRDAFNPKGQQPDMRVLRSLSGLGAPVEADGSDLWPSQKEVAEDLGLTRAQVADVVDRARTRWTKKKSMTVLRDDVARLLTMHGGVATHEELARAILQTRGTSNADRAEPLRSATAALWAALELESSQTTCRFRLQRGERLLAVVRTAAPGESGESTADPGAVRAWVEQLGAAADRLADVDPPLPPLRALEDLQAIPTPAGIETPSADRLLRLAVSASEHAAMTPRQELYRRGLPAARAVLLGAGALLGARQLSVEQVQQRIAARYPEAQAIPGRPELDRLLEAAGVRLVWNDARRCFEQEVIGSSLTGSGTQTRTPSGSSHPILMSSVAVDAAAEEVEDLERRIARLLNGDGGFLALTTEPKRLSRAERELERLGFARLSLERLLLDAMRSQALSLNAQWPVVLEADSADTNERAWRQLQQLVQRASPAVAERLDALDRPTVLVNAGLLARYGILSLLQPLQERTRRGPGVVMLIPGDGMHTMPVIDESPLPVVHPSDWARAPKAWPRSTRTTA